jgi:hypothetical protein
VPGNWQVEFFKDPRTGRVPAREFLERIPDEPAAELLATLKAVEGTSPPFAFRGGARWQAMRDEMSGWFEARDKHEKLLYRLFVRLEIVIRPACHTTPSWSLMVTPRGTRRRSARTSTPADGSSGRSTSGRTRVQSSDSGVDCCALVYRFGDDHLEPEGVEHMQCGVKSRVGAVEEQLSYR